MTAHFRSRQTGISFIGLLFFAAVLAMGGVVAAQIFPTAIEYMAIQRAAQKAATDDTTPDEIRSSFGKSADINDIKSITGKDLDISKQGDKVVVAFSYQREIHLVGPAFLTFKYEGQSK